MKMGIDTATAVLTSGVRLNESTFGAAVDAATALPNGVTAEQVALRTGMYAPWDLTAADREILGITSMDEEFGTTHLRVEEFRRAHPEFK